jgi:hypothetical protein
MSIKVRNKTNFQRIAKRAKLNNIETLGQAGAYVMTVARNSIKKSKQYAPVGQPVRTRRGAIKKAILFAPEKDRGRVTIGPAASRLGKSTAGAHEFGQRFRGRKYPARPFMGPALTTAAPKLPKRWQNILKGA